MPDHRQRTTRTPFASQGGAAPGSSRRISANAETLEKRRNALDSADTSPKTASRGCFRRFSALSST
eukprot:5428563-Alexandrium_andersonii.AAC.1